MCQCEMGAGQEDTGSRASSTIVSLRRTIQIPDRYYPSSRYARPRRGGTAVHPRPRLCDAGSTGIHGLVRAEYDGRSSSWSTVHESPQILVAGLHRSLFTNRDCGPSRSVQMHRCIAPQCEIGSMVHTRGNRRPSCLATGCILCILRKS